MGRTESACVNRFNQSDSMTRPNSFSQIIADPKNNDNLES